MSLNTSDNSSNGVTNNSNSNNSSFLNMLVDKVQDIKQTIDEVNAENEKANDAVKAVQEEKILKTFGMDDKTTDNSNIIFTESIDNDVSSSNNVNGNASNGSEIDLQSDKFVMAKTDISNSADNINLAKEGIGNIIKKSQDLDVEDVGELSNDMKIIKDIGEDGRENEKSVFGVVFEDNNNPFENGMVGSDRGIVLEDESDVSEEIGDVSFSTNKLLSDEPLMGMIYDQTEYGEIKYGIGDLGSNGCGFFSSLSAVTAKTGYQFSYDEIVELASTVNEGNNSSLSNEQRMEILLDILSDEEYISSWYRGDVDDVVSSLESGKAVIALTNNSSHFVPITGIKENGNIVINDTDGNAYRSNLWRRQRIDDLGFDMKNGEFLINARYADIDGDGINDDVWYLEFIESNDIKNEEINDESVVTDVSLSEKKSNDIPRIFQTDYSNVKYGGINELTGEAKTVATSGCGITCMAMVDNFYNDESITPAEVISMSGYYGCSTGTGYEFFPMYSKLRNLPYVESINYSTTESFDEVKEYLAEGGVAVANMTADSIFTKDTHYILLTGINEEGKILVNDPNKANYKEFTANPGKNNVVGEILTDGFANGFDESQFWYGKAVKFWVFADGGNAS